MPAALSVIEEVTHHMALGPLLWLVLLRAGGQRPAFLWWILAGVFGISWLADTASHWVSWWVVSGLYPIAQVTLLAAALLSRAEWLPFCWWFGAAALLDLLLAGLGTPELFVHTLAWGALILIVWRHPESHPLRLPVMVSFGLGWLGWIAFLVAPTWGTWGAYQSIRALGLGVFCWASVKAPQPVRV